MKPIHASTSSFLNTHIHIFLPYQHLLSTHFSSGNLIKCVHHLSSVPCMLHALPISLSLIRSSNNIWRRTSQDTPYYEIFSTLLLFPPFRPKDSVHNGLQSLLNNKQPPPPISSTFIP